MRRILAVRFGSCPAPGRTGVEGEQLLAALGPWHRMDALVPREGDQPFFDERSRARLIRVPLPGGAPAERAAAFGRAAARQIAAEEYELLWLSGPPAGLGGVVEPLLEALPPSVALVVEPGRGDLLPAEEAGGGGEGEPAWSRRAAVVVARSDEAARALPETVRARGVAAVVEPAVDIDRFDDEPPTAAAAGPATLLVGGRGGLTGRAGLRRLAEAAARLDGTLRLLIPGAADERTQAALAAVAPGCLEWTGPVSHEQMPALHERAIGAVFASPLDELEGLPLLLLEAMACGRVALAPGGPAASHLLDEGRAGVALSPELFGPDGDAATLASVLRALLTDAEGRRSLGRAARARVREQATASARRRSLRSVVARALPPRP